MSKCSIHGETLVHEAGGDDMPTLHGRTYCPSCQSALLDALDIYKIPLSKVTDPANLFGPFDMPYFEKKSRRARVKEWLARRVTRTHA